MSSSRPLSRQCMHLRDHRARARRSSSRSACRTSPARARAPRPRRIRPCRNGASPSPCRASIAPRGHTTPSAARYPYRRWRCALNYRSRGGSGAAPQRPQHGVRLAFSMTGVRSSTFRPRGGFRLGVLLVADAAVDGRLPALEVSRDLAHAGARGLDAPGRSRSRCSQGGFEPLGFDTGRGRGSDGGTWKT